MKKLTLRDLFWLVLVAALCVGWWLSYRQQASEIERLGNENAILHTFNNGLSEQVRRVIGQRDRAEQAARAKP